MKDTKNTEPRLPITHELKCWPEPFAAVVDGTKTFEWRKDDRLHPDDFRVGDTLWLREVLPIPDNLTAEENDTLVWHGPEYTGQHIYRTVTYIIREGFGIPPGYCIMGLAAARSKDKERIAALEAGLRELVRLKDETEQMEAILLANPYDSDAQKKRWDLHDVKPAAWDAARALLNPQPPTT